MAHPHWKKGPECWIRLISTPQRGLATLVLLWEPVLKHILVLLVYFSDKTGGERPSPPDIFQDMMTGVAYHIFSQ